MSSNVEPLLLFGAHLVLPGRKHHGETQEKEGQQRKGATKGEGQRDNGLYYYRWSDDAGNRHCVYGATLDELRRKEDATTQNILSGAPPEASKMTLNNAVEAWRQFRMKDVSIGALKLTTINQYLNAYKKHVRAPLGSLKIKDINKAKLYAEKMAQGLQYSQIANTAKPVNQTFALAEESGWIRRSAPMDTMLSTPKVHQTQAKTRHRSPSHEQEDIGLNQAKTSKTPGQV